MVSDGLFVINVVLVQFLETNISPDVVNRGNLISADADLRFWGVNPH